MASAYIRIKYYPANSKMKVTQRGKARNIILWWTKFCLSNGDISKEELMGVLNAKN